MFIVIEILVELFRVVISKYFICVIKGLCVFRMEMVRWCVSFIYCCVCRIFESGGGLSKKWCEFNEISKELGVISYNNIKNFF